MDWSTILSSLISGAGAGAGVFSFLGKKWIENKFAEEREEFKSEKRKELENLRYEINTLFNRVVKIHEKEYEVLPTAWSRLHKAKDYIGSFCSPLQQSYVISNMEDTEIRNALSKNDEWEDYQINELLDSSDRDKYYNEKIQLQAYNKVRSLFSEFHSYIVDNRIFFTKELKELFVKADDLMWKALRDKRLWQEGHLDVEKSYEPYKELRDNIDSIISDIEKLMQERLRYNEA
jgi:hypothetical protein